MEIKAKGHSKLLIVLILAVVAGILWLLSLLFAYSEFQNTRLTEPLAEMNSLFPLYYMAIALVALSILSCVIWNIRNKCVHAFLLMLFAAMLWLTPYLIAGFVRLPDSPWHVGVSMTVPEVLDGYPVAMSNYAWDYPGSFIYHYTFLEVIGIEPETYIYVFPAIFAFVFAILCYVVVARLFDNRVALLGMLIGVPGLHYLQLHASPHVVGSLLMLTALLLLVSRGVNRKVTLVSSIVILLTIVTHPTMPLLISIFLAAGIVIGVVYNRRISRMQMALVGILIICFVGWFLWFAFYPSSPLSQSLGLEMKWKTVGGLYYATMAGVEEGGGFLSGTEFVYSNIYNLNKAVYFFYASMAVLGLLYVVARDYAEKKNFKVWVFELGGLNRSETLLALSVLPLLVLTYLLAWWHHDLIETGLTYIILALSCIIASVVIRMGLMDWRPGRSLLIAGVLFLTLSYPVVAYSIDAYSSFPRSEKEGLKFLAAEVPLEGKIVAGMNTYQIALYRSPLSGHSRLVSLNRRNPTDLVRMEPDIILFRNTWYYYRAMRFDLSFESNRYTQSLAIVEGNQYNKIYSSPTFEVFSEG